MPLITSIGVSLEADEVLDRLPLSSAAFSARPAPAVVRSILELIEEEDLITPRSCYRYREIDQVKNLQLEMSGGTALAFRKLPEETCLADGLYFVAWSLGPRIGAAVSSAYEQRRYLQGFLLHEIASLLLFQLGEKLVAQLREKAGNSGLNIGQVLAPGDGDVALSQQTLILAQAGGERIGIDPGRLGILSPTLSATAVAIAGHCLEPSVDAWSCATCQSRASCRLRPGGARR